MIHELKIHSYFVDDIVFGIKTFEVRKNDRDFKVEDELLLKEYDPETNSYTGCILACKVTYILKGGQFGIQEGYVVMGIVPLRFTAPSKIQPYATQKEA